MRLEKSLEVFRLAEERSCVLEMDVVPLQSET